MKPSETIYSTEAVATMCHSLMTEHQRAEFAKHRTADLGHSASGGERFRINCYSRRWQAGHGRAPS